ncbi:hypothetical protein MPH_06415, partial [Macrophomina phaseolina MS6]
KLSMPWMNAVPLRISKAGRDTAAGERAAPAFCVPILVLSRAEASTRRLHACGLSARLAFEGIVETGECFGKPSPIGITWLIILRLFDPD